MSASNSFRDTALQKLGIFSKKLKSFVYVSYFVKYHQKYSSHEKSHR
jgi:hypothetical protein